MKEVVSVLDEGVRLDIPFESCVLYHGKDSIGGLSLGYRLLYFALQKLCGESIPERREVSFRTAFPGPGVRDAVEMVTRAVTGNRYHILNAEDKKYAPEGVYGRMYFEISVGQKTLICILRPGVISEEFITTGRNIKKSPFDEIERKKWRRLKNELSDAVWKINNLEDIFTFYLK